MATDGLGFGILGSGNMARVYAEALTGGYVTGGRLVAFGGGSRAGETARDYGVAAAGSPEAVLERPDVDVVVIATPHSTHLPLTLAAAAAGKHVYLEKPMALDAGECDRMIDACAAAGVRLTVAKQTRHGDPERTAKRLIDEGVIGEVRIIRAISPHTDWGLPADHWGNDPEEGGAWLDWGSHACDGIRWLSGREAESALATATSFTGGPISDLTTLAVYRLEGGAIAEGLLSYELPEPGLGSNNQYLVIGSEGMLEFDLDVLRLGKGEGWQTLVDLPQWIRPFQPKNPRRIKRTSEQIQAFLDAVARDDPHPITGEDGRAAVAMVDAAKRSIAEGRMVPVEHRGRADGSA